MKLQEFIEDDASTDDQEDDEEKQATDLPHHVGGSSIVDHSREYKLCPTCLTICKRENRMTWNCENSECGTLKFTTGFTERPGNDGWLNSIPFEEVFDVDA